VGEERGEGQIGEEAMGGRGEEEEGKGGRRKR
jgi:hypothetical protein